MPVEHYENFPVASMLLPRPLREPVEAIYAFARSADDIADEGDIADTERLTQLDAYRAQLDVIAHGGLPADPMFARLARNVEQYSLPVDLLRALLDAFSQDVVKKRYADFEELRAYCRRSADPVGRLLLHLYKRTSADQLRLSDKICTSLQLINFWQDVAIDWSKGRVYLPQEELARFGVTEADIAAGKAGRAWRALMTFQVHRARKLMLEGAPLAMELPGRVGWELRVVAQGGLRILEKIEAAGYDVFRQRPALEKSDWWRLAGRSLLMRAA